MERYSGIVSGSNIHCKNNCGYYANPCWENYCSRCYREAQLKKSRLGPTVANLSNASSRAFSKFEAKRKKVAGKSASTVQRVLKISKDEYETSSNIPEDAAQARAEFSRVLKTWRTAPGFDVSKQITKLLRELNAQEPSDINRFSNAVKDFYNYMAQRIYNNRLYHDSPTEQKEALINAIERFLSVWIYPYAFAPGNTDDEEVDIKVQDRIRSHHWVSHVHLDAPIDPSSLEQSRYLEGAILNLIRINEVLSTEAKLDQIVYCCREIFQALRIHAESLCSTSPPPPLLSSHSRHPATTTAVLADLPPRNKPSTAANTDDFLPALIWILLRANPPLLHSNLQFIMRFASETRLNTGEAAYYFTNLCCAMEFIKALTPKCLRMTQEEYDAQMRDGVSVTFCPVDIPNALAESERRYDAINQKLDEFDTLITQTENNLQTQQARQTAFIFELRQQRPMKKTVYLDPRELETPHIICLGPPEMPVTTTANQQPAQMYSRNPTAKTTVTTTNILDELTLDDVQTPCLVPSDATPR